MDYEPKLDKVKHKNSETIIYCRFGGRSELACELLTENGFSKIYNMMGNILAWIEGGFPVYFIRHNVIVENSRKIEIAPIILEKLDLCNCGCLYDEQDYQNISETIHFESTILKENESHKKILYKYEINGSVYENILIKFLLFSY